MPPAPKPRARRTAISRCRVSARTRNRFATFAHAINSTSPTEANKIQSARSTCPTVASLSVMGADVSFPSPTFPNTPRSPGYAFGRSAIRPLSSVRAFARVAPSRNRAIPRNLKGSPNPLDRVTCCAIHASTRESGKTNDAGITPTISVGTPFNIIGRPSTRTSPPYRRIHIPCDRTATGAAPTAPSSSVNQRPSAGRDRSTDASDVVALVTRIRSGSPPPVSVSSSVRKIATPSKVRARSRY